jgi:uncharacterized protein YhaN
MLTREGKRILLERSGNNNKIKFIMDGVSSEDESGWLKCVDYASAELFRRIYAITIDELRGMESLTISGVEDKMFSLAMGLSGVSLRDIVTDLEQQSRQIYAPRSRKNEVSGLLAELNEIEKTIKDIQQYLPRYQQLVEEKQELEKQKSQLSESLQSVQAESIRIQNYLKCHPHILRIRQLDEELDHLPAPADYPPSLLREITELELARNEVQKRLEILELGEDDEISLQELKRQIEEIQVRPLFFTYEEEIEQQVYQFSAYQQDIKRYQELKQNILRLEEETIYQIHELSPKWDIRKIESFTKLHWLQDRMREHKNETDALEKEISDLKGKIQALELSQSPIDWNVLSLIFSALFIGVGIVFSFTGNYIWAAVSGIAGIILLAGRKWYIRESMVDKLKKQLENVLRRREQALQRLEEFQKQYLGMEGYSADGMIEILAKIGEIQKQISEIQRQKKQLSALEDTIGQFEQAVVTLVRKLELNFDDVDTEATVLKLKQMLREEREKKLKTERFSEEYHRRLQGMQRAKEQLKHIEKKITDILHKVQATDITDFRKKYELNQEVQNRMRERENEIRTIEGILGEDGFENTRRFFEQQTVSEVETHLNELKNKEAIVKEELTQKIRRIGEIDAEMRQLRNQEDLAKWLTLKEAREEALREMYKNWLSYQLALQVLNQVKAKFERERQPEVIRKASEYFSRITNNRYQRIQISVDEKKVLIFDDQEKIKTIDQLSRGTKEQLLLCLRMGFIEEYEQHAEPLPVILDEVLINFDQERSKRTAEVLTAFAQKRQVFLFTCHPSMVDLFDKKRIHTIQL